MRKILLVCVAVFVLFVFGQSVRAADWQISELDDMGVISMPTEVSTIISLKADLNNKIHISYYDITSGHLKYASNVSGLWVVETIDDTGDAGIFSSLAIDSNNKVHIAYSHTVGAVHRLKYVNNISGVWQYYILDSSINAGYFPSMAIDSNDKIHIAYQDMTNNHLKYATNSFGDWGYETLDTTVNSGLYNSLAIDLNNRVHIAYTDGTNNYLKYITNALGSWAIMIIDDSVTSGYFNSLALDSNNKAHISYLYYAFPSYVARYATNSVSSSDWLISDIDNSNIPIWTGFGDCLVFDSNGKIRISYYEYNGTTDINQIKHATNFSGSFEKNTLNDTDSVGYLSLDVDSKNRSHLAYYDETTHKLKYAYTPGPSDEATIINNGRNYSAYRKINIDSFLTGEPTEMIVSTKSDFSDKTWKVYDADKIFKMPAKKGKKTIYVKYRDSWHAESDVVSQEVKYVGNPKFVTKRAKKSNEIKIKNKNRKYYAKDLNLTFKKYPSKFKNTKRYFLVERQKKYTKLYADAKKNLLKKYWKITTDFNKYNFDKFVKLKLVFSYSDSEFKFLKKKIKGFKEKNLYLKVYDSELKEWADLLAKHNKEKNIFMIYLNSPFEKYDYYYAIGR